MEEAKREIIKQIKAVEKDASKIDTPISVALDLQILRQSDNPEQRSLADLVSAIAELRTGLGAIEKRLSEPELLLPPRYLSHVMRRMGPMRRSLPPGLLIEIRNMIERLLKTTKPLVKNKEEYMMLKEMAIYLDEYVHREDID